MTKLNDFTKRLGYEFNDAELLQRALTHGSARSQLDNEHLEFLGDRVLGLAIAAEMLTRHPQESEGHLSRRLAVLVSRDVCAQISASWRLDEVLITDAKTNRKARNILADGCEAVLGAIYLDGGLAAAQKTIATHWQELMSQQVVAPQNPKTELQEKAMAEGLELPIYTKLKSEGADHAPQFTIEVSLDGKSATAQGGSVRNAEVAAAAAWLSEFDDE